jgi:DNA-binding protein HU-beta
MAMHRFKEGTMNKPEIVALIAQQANVTRKTAEIALQALVKSIHTALQNESGKIHIASLGTFKVLDIDPRRGVNPRTGEEMTIPAMRVPRFTPAKALKESVQADAT